MSFISKEIMDYVEKHTSDEPKLLQELRRETWQKVKRKKVSREKG